MSNKFHQISFKAIFSGCQDMFIDDVPSFFDLLEEHLDISSFIPDFFLVPFTVLSDVSVFTLVPASFQLLSCRRFFQYLQIQCLSFS